MKPTSKTPYEIRLELLQLAQVVLADQHKSRASLHPTNSSPTSEEIIAEAEKLNAFVSKANPSH